jgi:hypothetical protein
MDETFHSMTQLFAQLGLPSAPGDIQHFIEAHGPLPERLALHNASFWSAAQASFLCENIGDDADWAEVIDRLSAALRKPNLR